MVPLSRGDVISPSAGQLLRSGTPSRTNVLASIHIPSCGMRTMRSTQLDHTRDYVCSLSSQDISFVVMCVDEFCSVVFSCGLVGLEH